MEKEKIFISASLKSTSYGELVAKELFEKLPPLGYEIIEINNNKQNVWCRDYMPIVNQDQKLVQFKYAPSYMIDSEKWRSRIPNQEEIQKELNLNCKEALEFIIDGGAIEIHGKQGIISDRVLRENDMEQNKLIEAIQEKLNLARLIVIPQYPYDFTGHVDGMVRFINNETVLINDVSQELELVANDEKHKKNIYRSKLIKNWYYSFLMAFHNVGIETEILPSNYANNTSDKHGNGIYLNFLKLSKHIVMPSYNNKKYDRLAVEKLRKVYDREVITLDASKLAIEGGMINCITWTDRYIQ